MNHPKSLTTLTPTTPSQLQSLPPPPLPPQPSSLYPPNKHYWSSAVEDSELNDDWWNCGYTYYHRHSYHPIPYYPKPSDLCFNASGRLDFFDLKDHKDN